MMQITYFFLDEDYVFHEDYALLGMEPPVTAENYYSEVNFMLKRLGRTYLDCSL